jgi:hypothetical protein
MNFKSNLGATLLTVGVSLVFVIGCLGCSDDDSGNNCVLSFSTINGESADQISELELDEDASEDPGFQVDVVVATEHLPAGTSLTLSGGLQDQSATTQDDVAEFSGYTIPVGEDVTLSVTGAGCAPITKWIRVNNPAVQCEFVGINDGDSLSCSVTGDDSSPDPGLQINLTLSCPELDDGQEVTLQRNGEDVALQQIATGSVMFDDVFLIGGGENCEDLVELSAIVDTGDGTELYPLTVNAECCDSPGCEIVGYLPEGPIQGLPFGDTFNISTDADTFTPGLQVQVGIATDSLRVWKAGVRVTSLDTYEVNEYFVEDITADEIYVGTEPIDFPEGDVMIEPLCVLENESDPFTYPDSRKMVYVDTRAPECPTDLTCEIGNPRVAELNCQWTTPDDPGVEQDVMEWDFRFASTIGEQAACTEAELDNLWDGLETLPGSTALASSNYGSANVHTFEPLDPGLTYCVGSKVIDYAGNISECISPNWAGNVEIRRSWLSPCGTGEYCSFGYALAGADINCDGYKDLLVGAPDYGSGTPVGAEYYGEGRVYIYFGSASGIQSSSTPNIVIEANAPDLFLGYSIANLGNYTNHSGSESACEDVAVTSLLYDYNSQGVVSGAVYIFRGKTQWNPLVTEEDADISIYNNHPDRHGYESFGTSLANIGDFNGDSHPDLAIGAPYQGERAAVYLLNGGKNLNYPAELLAPSDMDLQVIGNSFIDLQTWQICGDDFGANISATGDLDGDGFNDMIIGAPANWVENCTNERESAAYIVFGAQDSSVATSLDVLVPEDRITTIRPDSGGNIINIESLGNAVAGLGDINGDGFLDIAVSDPDYGGDVVDATENYGAVFVFFGDSDGFRGMNREIEIDEADLWIRSQEDGKDRFGIAMGTSVEVPGRPLGDYDHDGLADLFIGTEFYGENHGSVFFLYGSTSLVSVGNWINWNAASFWLHPPAPCGRWGASIAYIGDTNGDDYTDVAVGDFYYPRTCDSEAQLRGRLALLY